MKSILTIALTSSAASLLIGFHLGERYSEATWSPIRARLELSYLTSLQSETPDTSSMIDTHNREIDTQLLVYHQARVFRPLFSLLDTISPLPSHSLRDAWIREAAIYRTKHPYQSEHHDPATRSQILEAARRLADDAGAEDR